MQGLATAVRNDTPISGSPAGEAGPVQDARRQALTAPFALTHDVQSVHEAVRRLRCGGIDGSRTWRFDLFLNRRSTGAAKDARSYSVAIVELRSSLDTQLSISRRGLLRKAAALDAPELEVGTDALRRRFVVRGNSAELAADVLDEQLCAWLIGAGRGFHFEITERPRAGLRPPAQVRARGALRGARLRDTAARPSADNPARRSDVELDGHVLSAEAHEPGDLHRLGTRQLVAVRGIA